MIASFCPSHRLTQFLHMCLQSGISQIQHTALYNWPTQIVIRIPLYKASLHTSANEHACKHITLLTHIHTLTNTNMKILYEIWINKHVCFIYLFFLWTLDRRVWTVVFRHVCLRLYFDWQTMGKVETNKLLQRHNGCMGDMSWDV